MADKLKRQREDEMNWLSGQYVLSAFSVVVSAVLNKKSKVKYLDRPILEEMEKSKKSADEVLEVQMEVFVNSFASNTDLPPTVFTDIRKGET